MCAVFAEGAGDEDTTGSRSPPEPYQIFPSPAQVGFITLHCCSCSLVLYLPSRITYIFLYKYFKYDDLLDFYLFIYF